MHTSATRTYQHAHYLLRAAQNKPTSPIEIPSLRKSSYFRKDSPSECPLSPEPIFEMSPINERSSSPFAMQVPLAFTDSQSHIYPHPGQIPSTGMTPPAHEPFMYPFPIFSHQHFRSTDGYGRTSDNTGSPSSSPLDEQGPFTKKWPHQNDFRVPTLRKIDASAKTNPRPRHPLQVNAKRVVENKITGIKPAAPIQSKTHALSPRLRYVAPPTLSSPLRVGGSEDSDELVSSVETLDSGTLDFEKYLIRCMENEKPFRFRKANTLSNMRTQNHPAL